MTKIKSQTNSKTQILKNRNNFQFEYWNLGIEICLLFSACDLLLILK
jgi:hypothetical protein